MNNPTYKRSIFVILFVLGISSCNQVSGAIIWEETFEILDNWEFLGVFTGDEYDLSFVPKYTLVDGALAVPFTDNTDNISVALRYSTIVYGTWSFDIYILPEANDTICTIS